MDQIQFSDLMKKLDIIIALLLKIQTGDKY